MAARDVYEDHLTLREARDRYFAANAFGADGGYSLEWVPVKVGPILLRIPNTASRRRAVRFHDLHHTLTGYPTNFRGECEISDDALLDRRLGEVRAELGLSAPPPAPRLADRFAFAGWALVAALVITTQAALSPLALPAIAMRSRLGRPRASSS